LKFLILRSYVASKAFNPLSIASYGNQGGYLFAFVCHSDPTKVLVGERETADEEVKLLTLTEDRTVSLDPLTLTTSGGCNDNIDKLFDEGNDAGQEHSIEKGDDVPKETIAKDVSEVAVEKTKKKRKRKAVGDASGSTLPPKKLREDYHAATSNVDEKSLAAICGLISKGSSVSSSHFEVNYFARSPAANALAMTVVVTPTIDSDVSTIMIPNVKAGADVAGTLKLNEPATSSDSFYTSQDLDSETLHNIYVPKWTVTNDSILDDPYVCRDMMDRLAPPALFLQLRAMDYDQLYTEFNVREARQMCLEAEVRIRAEHTLEQKDRLEDKCVEQTAFLSEKEVEISHLKSLLSLREAEVAEAIRLCGQLSIVEAVDAANSNELRDLKKRNFALEGEKDVLSEKATTLKSVTALKETQLASLTAQAISCAINKGIQDGLKAKVDHGKAGRDLSVIEAYDPSVEAKTKGEIMEKCLSLTDVMVPLAEPLSSQSLIGEASAYVAPAMVEPVTTLSTTFVSSSVVPPLFVSDYQVSNAKPHDENPPAITYEGKELDTIP
nr:hypothetical protein [Tanacetum cinerariifolium]